MKRTLLVCVSGDVPYWKSSAEHRQRIVSLHGRYDKRKEHWTWDERPTDLSPLIYDTLLKGRVGGLFMGSGRICQSRLVKVGKYHRLYAALCTHKGNFVIFSDDFGRSWDVLGSAEHSCAIKGDEAKCEELPDGSVLLSSRKNGGRWFNVFRYTDVAQAKGCWGAAVDSQQAPDGISNQGTPCNGEILILPAKRLSDGRSTYVALQSIPAGPNRSNVSIYYKELSEAATYTTPLRFASHWEGSYQVSSQGSAYSTMVRQADGRIAFFYEEEPGIYQMVYRALTLTDITGGRFDVR